MTALCTLYQRLGEDRGLKAIARSLYGWMERLPEATHIHALHQIRNIPIGPTSDCSAQ